MAFWRGTGDDVDLPIIESHALIELGAVLIAGKKIRQEYFGGSGFDDDIKDSGARRIGEALRCHDHHTIGFAQSFQPLAYLFSKCFMAEHQPCFINDNGGGLPA